jgi:hypothetical protein
MSTDRVNHDLEWFVQPHVGLISRVTQLASSPGEPSLSIVSAAHGDVGQVLPNVPREVLGRSRPSPLDGARRARSQ